MAYMLPNVNYRLRRDISNFITDLVNVANRKSLYTLAIIIVTSSSIIEQKSEMSLV